MRILEDDISALAVKLIHHLRYIFLISGNRMRREHNGVARLDLYLLVDAAGHAREGRHGFSLASRRDQNQLLIRVILHLLQGDQRILRNLDISQFLRCRDHVHHGPPFNHHPAVIFVGSIDDLLYPVHVRREGRNDQAAVCVFRKDRVKCESDRLLRGGISGPFRIRGVAHQRQHALPSDLREPLQIDCVTENRCVVHLEISRVHDRARRAVNGKCHRILDRVIRPDELHSQLSEVDRLAGMYDLSSCCLQKLMLRKLQFDQTHGQLRRVDRNIQLLENIGERPDMILMSMCKYESFDLVFIFQKIGHIRNHQINSVHIVLRKCKAAVNHYDRILIFERSNIHTDGFQSAKRYDLQF